MYLLTTRTVPLLSQWCSSFDEQHKEISMQRRLADGRLFMVTPHEQGSSLILGMPVPFHRLGVFADSWDYTNDAMAYYAYHTWDPMNEGEPLGWTHHHATGRTRLDGDPERQYIESEGTLQEQVIHACMVSIPRTHHIQTIEEIPLNYQTIFPPTTKCFVAYTESEQCRHTPKCQISYTLLYHQGRCVVLTFQEILLFDEEKVLACLTATSRREGV